MEGGQSYSTCEMATEVGTAVNHQLYKWSERNVQ